MSSYNTDTFNTATTVLSTGIIVAIAVGSAIGLAILICIIIVIYCVCCRKKQRYPGAIIQPQPNPGTGYNYPPTNTV